MKDPKNLTGTSLWDQVCCTDPKYTKKVGQRGGFTAINAQYQMHEATKIWGPYGSAWGTEKLVYGMISDGKGNPIEMTLDTVFYYPGGKFPISTDTAYRAGNDSRKKLLTDLTTKALSKLGFNADVFMGLYDDNKYANEVKQMYRKPDNPASVKGAGIKKATVGEVAFEKMINRIKGGELKLFKTSRDFFNLNEDQELQLLTLEKQIS